jgi:hypothetical protein
LREHQQVSIEPPQPIPEPGVAERAVDAATEVSQTITEVTAALRSAADRLIEAMANPRRPGKPLAIIGAAAREAPLASLFIAFVLGVAVGRRR